MCVLCQLSNPENDQTKKLSIPSVMMNVMMSIFQFFYVVAEVLLNVVAEPVLKLFCKTHFPLKHTGFWSVLHVGTWFFAMIRVKSTRSP